MRKNLFYFLSALLLIISFSSCDKGGKFQGKKVESLSTISFKFGFPKGDPVTYAIHDSHEYGFKSLFMYEFDVDGKLLKDPVDLASALTGAGPEYTYKHKVPSNKTGVRQFIFVANEAVVGMTANSSTISDLRTKVLSRIQPANTSSQKINDYTDANNYYIAMTGVAKSGTNTLVPVTGNSVVSVEMVRTVARIDVENNTPNLVITGLKLNNAPAKSLLLEAPNGTGITERVSDVSTFATLPTIFNNEDANKKLAKAFYLCEGRQTAEASATSINVVGTLGGVPVEYNIPFWKSGAGVDIQRNYIYRISLGDGTPKVDNTNLEFSITTADWNTTTVSDSFSAISAAYKSGAAAGYTYVNSVLTTNKTAQANILFDLSTNFTGHTGYTVTVKESPAWITTNIESNNQLKLNLQANNSATDREALIEVKSTTTSGNTYVYNLVVKQSK